MLTVCSAEKSTFFPTKNAFSFCWLTLVECSGTLLGSERARVQVEIRAGTPPPTTKTPQHWELVQYWRGWFIRIRNDCSGTVL